MATTIMIIILNKNNIIIPVTMTSKINLSLYGTLKRKRKLKKRGMTNNVSQNKWQSCP